MDNEKLTVLEKRTYNFIKERGKIQTRSITDKRMIGTLSTLKHKGLVTIYRRYPDVINPTKKRKYVKIL